MEHILQAVASVRKIVLFFVASVFEAGFDQSVDSSSVTASNFGWLGCRFCAPVQANLLTYNDVNLFLLNAWMLQ